MARPYSIAPHDGPWLKYADELEAKLEKLQTENAALKDDVAVLTYELWSLCDSEGVEWHGDIPENPETVKEGF